jgi:hypothetical protein
VNIKTAISKIEKLRDAPKYESMIRTASIITKLLEQYDIKPIVVGGLSVEIYTQNDYSTRDIDFVSEDFDKIRDTLFQLGFKRDTRHFYHEELEIAIEIPSSNLAGDYERVLKVEIDKEDDLYVYLISIEDIILDRLRATVHWKSQEDAKWGFKMLSSNLDDVDLEYLYERLDTVTEKIELDQWLFELGVEKIPN